MPVQDRFAVPRAVLWATLALVVLLIYAAAGLAFAGMIPVLA